MMTWGVSRRIYTSTQHTKTNSSLFYMMFLYDLSSTRASGDVRTLLHMAAFSCIDTGVPILSLSLSSLYDGRHRPFCGFISYEWSDMIIDPGMIF